MTTTELEMSWHDAVNQVLSMSSEPLHYREITRQIIENGIKTTKSKTPEASVNGVLTRFSYDYVRVSTGVYRLRTEDDPAPNAAPVIGERSPEAEAAEAARRERLRIYRLQKRPKIEQDSNLDEYGARVASTQQKVKLAFESEGYDASLLDFPLSDYDKDMEYSVSCVWRSLDQVLHERTESDRDNPVAQLLGEDHCVVSPATVIERLVRRYMVIAHDSGSYSDHFPEIVVNIDACQDGHYDPAYPEQGCQEPVLWLKSRSGYAIVFDYGIELCYGATEAEWRREEESFCRMASELREMFAQLGVGLKAYLRDRATITPLRLSDNEEDHLSEFTSMA